MPTSPWTNHLRFGCEKCGEGFIHHPFSCDGRLVALEGPGDLLMYWWLLDEIEREFYELTGEMYDEAVAAGEDK